MGAAIRTRSGLLVRRDGDGIDPQPLHCFRCEQIDALVREVGAVEALDRFEAALAVCLKQSSDAAARGHLGVARGFEAAACYLRQSVSLLIERHA